MHISHAVKGQPDVQNLAVLSHLPDSREGQPLNIGAQTAYVLCKGLWKHVYAPLHQVTGSGPAFKHAVFCHFSVCAAESLHHIHKNCFSITVWLQQVHVYNIFCHSSVRAAESLHITLTKTAQVKLSGCSKYMCTTLSVTVCLGC